MSLRGRCADRAGVQRLDPQPDWSGESSKPLDVLRSEEAHPVPQGMRIREMTHREQLHRERADGVDRVAGLQRAVLRLRDSGADPSLYGDIRSLQRKSKLV